MRIKKKLNCIRAKREEFIVGRVELEKERRARSLSDEVVRPESERGFGKLDNEEENCEIRPGDVREYS